MLPFWPLTWWIQPAHGAGRKDSHTLLMARWKEVLEPLVAIHQGRVFKWTGDGVFVDQT